jgi:hypothetical protein
MTETLCFVIAIIARPLNRRRREMKAPNETDEGYERKLELMEIRKARELTLDELNELSALTKAAISHMQFSTLRT